MAQDPSPSAGRAALHAPRLKAHAHRPSHDQESHVRWLDAAFAVDALTEDCDGRISRLAISTSTAVVNATFDAGRNVVPEYTNHHYVPQWYQRRFIDPDSRENVLQYLALRSEVRVDAKGAQHQLPSRRRRPIRKCFAEEDLYTLRFADISSTAIERLLFGSIDDHGKAAVDYWSAFQHPSVSRSALNGLLMYISAQKMRTPKGLDWLRQRFGADPNAVLRAMVNLRDLYAAIWAECVWQLADASQSETKFIVSDHPVTVYNRVCGPRSQWCRGPNDPDIRSHGSHTIFPLSLDRLLILTNLSWARNPYQSATSLRPNPEFYRETVFNVFEVQTHRSLSEQEVREINFIIKSRAYGYVAAGKQEWLYPEQFVSKSDWAEYGNGYLLMPDPRSLHHGGELIMGFADGSTDAFDDYGRKPWHLDYNTDDLPKQGRDPLLRFQGEFARLYGPYRRGRAYQVGRLEDERDSDDFHRYHLQLERPGKQRRRAGRSETLER